MQNRKKKTQMYRTVFKSLWEKARVVWFKRTALKHVYYLGWNRSPAQVGCMRQVLGPGALGRPRGIGWRGRGEGGSWWGTHVNPWLFQCMRKFITKKKKKNLPSLALGILSHVSLWLHTTIATLLIPNKPIFAEEISGRQRVNRVI